MNRSQESTEMDKTFDIRKELLSLGFEEQEKQRECLFTRGNVAIYTAITLDNFQDEWGHPTGMVIIKGDERIYQGKTPPTAEEFYKILSDCNIQY